MKLTAIYKKTGKWYTGWIEELQGVHTQGRTLNSCKNNLKDALSLYTKIRREISHKEFPKQSVIRESLSL